MLRVKEQFVGNPQVNNRVIGNHLTEKATVIDLELADLLNRQAWKRVYGPTDATFPREVYDDYEIAFAAQIVSLRLDHDLLVV